jgi:hypothetical protein
MNNKNRESHRSLLAVIFIGVTVLVFSIYFSWQWTQAAEEKIVNGELTVARLQEQVAAQNRLIALEPAVTQALSQATRSITPDLLVDEHESVEACASQSGATLSKYNVMVNKATVTITLAAPQNGTLRFLDCLDRVELPITPTNLTFIPADKSTLDTTLIGTLVHA